MYRVLTIIGASFVLAACSSTPSWLNLDALKPAPPTDTVKFESEPAGAEARTSTGQTCRTPCEINVPANGPFSVTFTLNGYQPESEQIELVSMGDGTSRLTPNPVTVELTPAPPPPKKPPAKRKPAAKPKTAAKPAAARPAAAPAPAAPASSASSPWPAPQSTTR